MSLSTLLSQTITIVRASQTTGTTDAEGNATSTAAATATYPGLIQQETTSEIRVGPDVLIADHRLFLGADAVIDGRDQVREGSRVFEIVGVPDLVRTPRGGHHWEVHLRSVTD